MMGIFDKARSLLRREAPAAKGRRKPNAPAPTVSAEELEQLRTRARNRLVGASLLLLGGIVAFALLFETQPRPLSSGVPIWWAGGTNDSARSRPADAAPVEAPAPLDEQALDEQGRAALALSGRVAGSSPAAVVQGLPPLPVLRGTPVAEVPAPGAVSPAPPVALAAPPAARPVASAAPVTQALPVAAPASKPRPPAVAVRAEPAPVARESVREPAREVSRETAREPVREQAPSAAADKGRYVVQVGAYADAQGARDARGKVESLGFKTYTQVIESASGRRVRVRVGPFVTRAEAEKAAARLKAAGQGAAVLSL
ncbi:SPOR domain-containing protein [Ideonella livida]|uniref:SPOR domain-containing protein n=1 Tax=Ideonella livida TaxID=2707176 RepID=A0A7C9TKV5_9BURK|nr:SPOR domain-containing protein [Ideonella livida]NDY92142.1 SPOR domain-containing protein [Ideonella livida]